MTKIRSYQFIYVLLALLLASTACSTVAPETPTPTVPPATNTPLPTPTKTVRPTSTPRPTATPNLAATKEAADLQARIQNYVQNGYLPSDKGDFYKLQDTTFEWAQKDWLNFEDAGYGYKIKNFAVWADINVSSASAVNYPEYSGCGFAFRYNEDKGDMYTVIVSKDRVLVTSCPKGSCYVVGKAQGTGRLGYKGDFKAAVELIVNETAAYVLADGQFIGEYTLSSEHTTDPGYFYYSIWSGTNKDYGTRCDYSNVRLWIPRQ
jgi:hypothetical protein